MTDNDGTLHMQPSGRWAIVLPGHSPVEITHGEMFSVEVQGHLELQVTRMEFRHIPTHINGGEYYSVDGFRLAEGLRVAR
jgi:hypothetical protein